MGRHRRPASAVAVFAIAAVFAGTALASFTSSSSATMTVATGTLAAPTALAAGPGTCTMLAQDRVVLTWTATSSTFADGYDVRRGTAAGGPYATIGSVSGHATLTYTDATVAFSTTYYYVVLAKRNTWRSPDSNEASITTRTAACLM